MSAGGWLAAIFGCAGLALMIVGLARDTFALARWIREPAPDRDPWTIPSTLGRGWYSLVLAVVLALYLAALLVR